MSRAPRRPARAAPQALGSTREHLVPSTPGTDQAGSPSQHVRGPRLLIVNGAPSNVDVDPRTPLLWVLRDTLGLTGTKYGCGIAQCGACTVHVDGRAVRSCALPVAEVRGEVTTIEGLRRSGRPHPLQRAWIAEDVPQCGYCQSGQIMSAAALLSRNPRPDDAAIDRAMRGNICRCGTYARIRRAIHRAAGEAGSEDG